MNHYAGYREVVVGEGEGLSEFNVHCSICMFLACPLYVYIVIIIIIIATGARLNSYHCIIK